MIIPFIPEDLFELNNNLNPQFDGEVIIIDDIFKNYKDILNVCNNTSVEQWKSSPSSRNFKDYYDCRLVFNNNSYDSNKLSLRLGTLNSIISSHIPNFNFNYPTQFTFNYFRHLKKDVSVNLQHFPHRDKAYNIIFYLDPFENGGTAIYEDVPLVNKEEKNLLFDISNLKVKKIIESKPNRFVIFPGHYLHGGYIKNHNIYYYNWRINLVHFLYNNNE